METMINKKEIPNKSRTLMLDKVIFYTVPTFEKGSCEPFFSIECQGECFVSVKGFSGVINQIKVVKFFDQEEN